jgi:hypothetical protein
MADTGFNKKISGVPVKWWLLGGTAAAVTVWYVYKKQQAASATTSDTLPADTSGYGDYSAASGVAGGGGGTPSNYGYYDQTTGQFIGLGGTTTVTGPGNNGAWTQAAAAYLIMQGYDPITVLNALGKYLNGTAVTQTEYNIVTAAIGIEGLPPDGAPTLHMEPPSQTQTGVLGAAPVLQETAHRTGAAAISWSQTPNATSYHVHYNGVPIKVTTSRAMTVYKSGRYQVFAFGKDNTNKASNILTIKV